MNQSLEEPDRHSILRAKQIRGARQALVLLAVMQIVGGVFLYFDLRRGDQLELLGSLLFQGLLAGLMLSLWGWSRRRPRGALVTALAIWCVLLLTTIILSPLTVLYGGVLAVVVTLVLIRGARAAVVEASRARMDREQVHS